MRPVVESIAAHQVHVFSARTVNEAILAELSREGVYYGNIVNVSRNAQGDVASIQSDMREINRLKANVANTVARELEMLGATTMRIPLGTLLGNEVTSGRGPAVEIKVYPTGYVQTELYSQFTSAGINQTLHQIILGTSVQMMAVIPGYRIECETTTNYMIAQTVIVGNIPESFTQINGDQAPLISKINDYAVR